MSNTRRLRPKLSLQRQLDLDAGLYCPLCQALVGHYPVEGHPGDWRVVTWSEGFFPTSWLDKQETPEIAVSEASTDRTSASEAHGGCSTQCA